MTDEPEPAGRSHRSRVWVEFLLLAAIVAVPLAFAVVDTVRGH